MPMKMLEITLRFLLILFTFITSVANEELNEFENEQISQENAGNQLTNDEVISNQYAGEANLAPDKAKEGNISDQKDSNQNQFNEENAGNQHTDQISDKTNQNAETEKAKFKDAKKPKSALWKFDDVSDKKLEPGFELTPEEMQKFKIWKDGVIPYYIDVISFGDKVLRDKIRNYLHMVNSVTSLSFVELPNPPSNDDERWVFFINRRGLLSCADHTVKNFTNQGVQQVVLGYDCIATKGELAEAVMSIAGVPAQHNAPDRDTYITVKTENILPVTNKKERTQFTIMAEKRVLFEKLNDNEWLFHDLEYDLDSITHYDIHKYSTNGRVTIQLKTESKDINPPKELSSVDILKIKMLYNYITRNKKLPIPDCQKLFKPRNNLEDFVPNRKPIKPRKKPGRYLGLSNAEEENYEESEKEDVGQSQGDANPNEEEDEEQDVENNVERNKDNERMKVSQKILSSKNRVISKIDALSLLSDYNTS